jgi:hypothetical protein
VFAYCLGFLLALFVAFIIMAKGIHDCGRFEVLTAAVTSVDFFWDIKTQFIPQRKHITSPLQSQDG